MSAQSLLGHGIAFVKKRPAIDVDFECWSGGHNELFWNLNECHPLLQNFFSTRGSFSRQSGKPTNA
jgi:hypothetical protein